MGAYGGCMFLSPDARPERATDANLCILLVIFGPMVVQWYRLLERSIRFPGRPNIEIVGRVAADQLIFTPVNMLCFFSGLTLLEVDWPLLIWYTYGMLIFYDQGGSVEEKLKSSYTSTLLTNWMVWPAVQLVNFKLVPLNHRLLVVNLISLGGLNDSVIPCLYLLMATL